MSSIKFAPKVIHVSAGQSVLWSNSDPVAHTVTADDGSFDSGLVDPGSSVSIEFDTPGTFQYFCQPHGGAGGDANTLFFAAGINDESDGLFGTIQSVDS